MNWDLIVNVTGPIILIMGWAWNRIDNRFDKMDQRFDRLENKIDFLDQRLSRLEGRFEERGYWESRKTGTEKK